ncbi:hypothetical protein PM082_008910 [Marasmius tenuissimus]|nr:hypothetical protein PM082_008910 [Marasmius tenuissimus]
MNSIFETATTLSWTLLSLSKDPDIQKRLREEIRERERQINIEGRSHNGFTAEDFDGMPYLNAVVKESLRYNTTAVHIPKMAREEDCIPLSASITLDNGEMINEIPVGKGQKILLSVHGYHRSRVVFGDDAHIFRPERWLDAEESRTKAHTSSGGIYSNLLTFSGGVRPCPGWRFAVLEIQAFVVELIANFEFSLSSDCARIRREICGQMMLPTLEGELAKGAQCPLRVRYARKEDSD